MKKIPSSYSEWSQAKKEIFEQWSAIAERNREQMIEIARSGWQEQIDADSENEDEGVFIIKQSLIEYFESALEDFLGDEIDEQTEEELASIQTDEDFMMEWTKAFAIPSPEAS